MDGPRIFLHAIAHQLGEPAPVAELPELSRDEGLLETFVALGLERYARSTQRPIELAQAAARATLERAGVEPTAVDALVYATSSFARPGYSTRDVRRLGAALGLDRAVPLGVFGLECANLHAALQTAVDAVATGRAARVLVVTADTCPPGESRVMPPDVTVLSDGACAAMVSAEPGRGPCFELRALAWHTDPAAERADPATQLAEYHARTSGGSRRAAEAVLARCGLGPADLAAVVTNNYNRSVARGLADRLGVRAERVHLANLPRFAHAYAADTLINLADLAGRAGDALAGGAPCLLLASGPSVWGATVAVRVVA